MRTQNKKLIKLLGMLEILESEKITENKPKTDDDVTFTVESFDSKDEYRIIVDSVENDEIELLMKAEELKTLKSIQNMLKFFTILTIIGLVGIFLMLIIN
ncbi:MAG: hypothetical protein E7417_06285 [Ruminococcaceae bacterium]|nr:hypothetical protein [Oscillospiraceae bacterium]